MPYRRGGHTTASAVAALGGESNYVNEPRRRRPPSVRSRPDKPSTRPAWHLHPSTLRFIAPLPACRHLHLLPTTCISSLHPVRIVTQDGTQPPRPLYDTVRAAWTAWLACCGERSLVLSTFPHESFPPHHLRALIPPHSTRCRPTSVQSTPFHASNFHLSLLCPVSSAIPHPEPPLIRAPRTRALPLSLPSCPRPMPFLMYRHSSSLPIRTLLFRQPFNRPLSFLRFPCNLSRSPY